MGFTHGLTKQEVFDAASEIFAQGKNPTQARVRAALGRGSFSTISKFLAEWRQENSDLEPATTTNSEMPENVRTLLERTYSVIRGHAESTVVGEQAELLEQENDRLRTEIEQLHQDLSELAGLRVASRNQLIRLEELTRENERMQKFLPQIDQVDELTEQLGVVQAENVELRGKIDQLEIVNESLAEQLQASERNLQSSINRCNEREEELVGMRANNAKLATQVAQLTDRNLELAKRAESCEDTLGKKLAEIEDLKAICNSLKQTKSTRNRKPKSELAIPDIEA